MVERGPGTVGVWLDGDPACVLGCVVSVLVLWAYDNSYRMATVGGGAFGLCLPSLGFFLPKRLLWSTILHRTLSMMWLG